MSLAAEPEFRSYYGQPILKEPVWRPEVPEYFFLGGLAGASAGLGFGARLAGNERLARNATFAGLVAVGLSPVLLIADLGRPERFLNMLRVFKVTSPMSVGTWVLSAFGAAIAVAAGCEVLGTLPRVRLVAQGAAAALGLPLSTYTAALLADTAVPAWHDARRELPFVFAGSAGASAGAVAAIVTPVAAAAPARRLAVAGALLELGAERAMEQRLGPLIAEPYRCGRPAELARRARTCTALGAALLAIGRPRRPTALAGGVLVLLGSFFERLAVFRAGIESARDPKYTVVPQRERVERRAGGSSRLALPPAAPPAARSGAVPPG